MAAAVATILVSRGRGEAALAVAAAARLTVYARWSHQGCPGHLGLHSGRPFGGPCLARCIGPAREVQPPRALLPTLANYFPIKINFETCSKQLLTMRNRFLILPNPEKLNFNEFLRLKVLKTDENVVFPKKCRKTILQHAILCKKMRRKRLYYQF